MIIVPLTNSDFAQILFTYLIDQGKDWKKNNKISVWSNMILTNLRLNRKWFTHLGCFKPFSASILFVLSYKYIVVHLFHVHHYFKCLWHIVFEHSMPWHEVDLSYSIFPAVFLTCLVWTHKSLAYSQNGTLNCKCCYLQCTMCGTLWYLFGCYIWISCHWKCILCSVYFLFN